MQGAGPNPTTLLIPSPESGQEQPQGHQSLFLTAGSRTHIPAHPRQTLSWESKVPGVTQLPRNARGEREHTAGKPCPGILHLLPPFLWPLCFQDGAETGAGFVMPWHRRARTSHCLEKATGIQGTRRGQCHPQHAWFCRAAATGCWVWGFLL